MKGIIKYSIALAILLTMLQGKAQKRVADSLLALLKPVKEDTNRVSHLNALAKIYTAKKRDTALVLVSEALALAKKIHWKLGEGTSLQLSGSINFLNGDFDAARSFYEKALEVWDVLEAASGRHAPGVELPKNSILNLKAKTIGNLGNVYKEKGEYPMALKCFHMSLAIAQGTGNKLIIGDNNLRIGSVYSSQAQFPDAQKYFLAALKIAEEINDKDKSAMAMNNLGNLFAQQSEFQKAFEYYSKTLAIDQQSNNRNAMARDLGNIGNLFLQQEKCKEALEYLQKALEIDEELGNKGGIIFRLTAMAGSYMGLRQYNKAEETYLKAIEMAKQLGDQSRMATNMANLGLLYVKQKKLDKAEVYLNKALELCRAIGIASIELECEASLSDLYHYKKNGKAALEHYQKYTALKDSIFNESKKEEITRNELNYEFEKKEAVRKSEQEKKDAIALAEKKKQELTLMLVSGFLVLVLIFVIFVARALNITRRQKKLIEIKSRETEEQKALIEEKNKDILDSIHYARRIQRSLLPTEKFIHRKLVDLNK